MIESGSIGDDFENQSIADLNLSIAHWHINSWGGAEYLVTKLAEALEVETVYTLGQPDPDDQNPYGDIYFQDITNSLDYSVLRRLQHRAGRVFEYAQWEDVDWRDFGDSDVIVTSGATTRAVITPDDTLHINYCHSTPRWFYDLYHDRKNSLSGIFYRPLIRYLRLRDATLDSRVDQYFVNSPIIRRRLWKYYKRESDVLYPPVELEKYRNEGDGGYYLHLGRLDKEKGIEAVVEAFDGLNKQLVMAGGMGNIEEPVVEKIRKSKNIDYRGFVSKDQKINLLANCTGVVFNGRNEDFGIVPIEANASGKPVLTRNDGFPGIFVDDGENGFLHDGTADSIRQTVSKTNLRDIDITPADHISSFSFTTFSENLRGSLLTMYTDFQECVRRE